MEQSIQVELQKLQERGLYRATRSIRGAQGARVILDDRDVVMLCSNNYLGLASHPALAAASLQAVSEFGTSSAASRLVSGTMELHEQLEEAVARFKRTESALLFNSGYAANTGIIPTLVGRGDTVFSDRLNHASIVDGILLSRARMIRYPHTDMEALARLLATERGTGRCLIVTDGVFSMDGDQAPLQELVALKQRHGALLMVDDAHGTGVLGERGAGTAEQQGVMGDIDIQMGTFGKALGSFGAYGAMSRQMRDLCINKARSFIFSTSLPPAVLAASLAALELVSSTEGQRLRATGVAHGHYFRNALRSAGFTVPLGESPIIPVMIGEAQRTMECSAALLHEGFFVQGIRPPTVPAGSSRLRCTVMATHCRDDLERAVAALVRMGRDRGLI